MALTIFIFLSRFTHSLCLKFIFSIIKSVVFYILIQNFSFPFSLALWKYNYNNSNTVAMSPEYIQCINYRITKYSLCRLLFMAKMWIFLLFYFGGKIWIFHKNMDFLCEQCLNQCINLIYWTYNQTEISHKFIWKLLCQILNLQ